MNVALISGGVKQDIWTRTEPMYERLYGYLLCLFKILLSGVGPKVASGGAESYKSIFLFIKYSSPTYVDFFIPP